MSRQDLCVVTRLGLGLGDQGRDRGFSITTGLSGHWVAIVGSVATGFGQGREALCRDMKTMSRHENDVATGDQSSSVTTGNSLL